MADNYFPNAGFARQQWVVRCVRPHPVSGEASYLPIIPLRHGFAPYDYRNKYVRLDARHLKPFSPPAVGDGPKETTVVGTQILTSKYLTALDLSCHEYNQAEAAAAAAQGRHPKLYRVVHDYIMAAPCLADLAGRDAKKFVTKLTGLLMDFDPCVGRASGSGVVGIVLGTWDTVSQTSPTYALAPVPGQAVGEVIREGGEASPCSNGRGGAHVEFVVSHLVPCYAEGDGRAADDWQWGAWTHHPCAVRYKTWLLDVLRDSGVEDRVLRCVHPRADKSSIYIQICILDAMQRTEHYNEVVRDRHLAPPAVLSYTDIDEIIEKLCYGPLQGLSRGDNGLTLTYIAENADRMFNSGVNPEHAAREPPGSPGTLQGGAHGSAAWQEWRDEIGGRPARVVQVSYFCGRPGGLPRTAMETLDTWWMPGPRPEP